MFRSGRLQGVPQLTVNLGMRWEYSEPMYEWRIARRTSNLVTGKVLLAGQDGNSRALYLILLQAV